MCVFHHHENEISPGTAGLPSSTSNTQGSFMPMDLVLNTAALLFPRVPPVLAVLFKALWLETRKNLMQEETQSGFCWSIMNR